VFTERYALSPYVKQTHLVFKELNVSDKSYLRQMILPHGLLSRQKVPVYQCLTDILKVEFTMNGGYSRLRELVTGVQVCHLKRFM
jgi:hypothetical protein